MKDKSHLLFVLLLIPVVMFFVSNSFSLTYTEEIKSVEIQSNDYDAPGSWHIDKSAEWTGFGKARVTFDVNSIMKTADGHYKDIILIMDISGSMSGNKLDRAKQDAIDLTNYLLSDSRNKVALVSFDSNSRILSNLTNNRDEIIDLINGLSTTGTTNYNSGLLQIDEILSDYTRSNDRDLAVLFLTDGYPNVDTPNEKATYKILKDKYPYMTINGIQYEMGRDIIQEIIDISDRQFVANVDTLNNVLFEASVTPLVYDNFVISDYINNDYFDVNSIDDIKVSIGEVNIENINGVQKVVWNMGNNYVTGRNAKMYINLSLKEQYMNTRGFYPTNKSETIISKLPDEQEKTKESELTPVLKNSYDVIYDVNTPNGCTLPMIPTEEHFVYQNVTMRQDNLVCPGYLYKGWMIDSNDARDIKMINDETFIMPIHDVTIRAIWTKQDIAKNTDGTVHEKMTLYKVFEREGKAGTYAIEYTGNHKDSYTREGTEKIYHWYAVNNNNGNNLAENILNKNNVIFAGQCWQMIRTTDTGGVKLIYNGEAVNNSCLSTRENHSGYSGRSSQNLNGNYWYGTDYEYDSTNKKYHLIGDLIQSTWSQANSANLIGKYTCKKTDQSETCDTLYLIESYISNTNGYAVLLDSSSHYSQFGKMAYNPNSNSPAYLGYMYNKVYTSTSKSSNYFIGGNLFDITDNRYFADSVDYGNINSDKYTLVDPVLSSEIDDYSELVGKYTMRSNSATSSNEVFYVVGIKDNKFYAKLLNKGDLTTSLTYGTSYTQDGDLYEITNPTVMTFIEYYNGGYDTIDGKYVCDGPEPRCSNLKKVMYNSTLSSYYYSDTSTWPNLYGETVSYQDGIYTLSGDIVNVWKVFSNLIFTHHYTCKSLENTCSTMHYINALTDHALYYIDYTGAQDFDDALDKMYICNDETNCRDSIVKMAIDKWYEHTLLEYDNLIDETIFCNDKSYERKAGFDDNGGVLSWTYGETYFSSHNSSFKDLSCKNVTDQYSVDNSNARLKYKVGLATKAELNLLGNSNIRKTGEQYWLMSPNQYWTSGSNGYVSNQGTLSYNSSNSTLGVRPVISLIPDIEYSSGDGSMENPYIIGIDE